MTRFLAAFILPACQLLDGAHDDGAGLLQLKQKQRRQRHTDFSSSDSPGYCLVYGDPHIVTFDRAQFNTKPKAWNCFAPGDYYILKSSELTITARYKGRGQRAAEGIAGASSIYAIAIEGPMIGGELIIPGLDRNLYRQGELVLPAIDGCGKKNMRHKGTYFFPTGEDGKPDRCNEMSLEPISYHAVWRDICMNDCKARPEVNWTKEGQPHLLDHKKINLFCTGECTQDKWKEKFWSKTHVLDKFNITRGMGPDPRKCDSCPCNQGWQPCASAADEIKSKDSYTIDIHNGVKILIKQSHLQDFGIFVPKRSLFGEIEGHCGNWDGEENDDGVWESDIQYMACPNSLFPTPQLMNEAMQLDLQNQPAMLLIAGVNEQFGMIGDLRGCEKDKAFEAKDICTRFFHQDGQLLTDCIRDCCEDRVECPDRDNGGAVKVCTATGDPHIKQFDSFGPKTNFLYPHGDFWLHKSDVVSVQARYSSSRADGKAQIRGLVIIGSLLGEYSVETGSFPRIDVSLLEKGGKDSVVMTFTNGRTQSTVNRRCAKESCHLENTDQNGRKYFRSVLDDGLKVINYFDKACDMESQDVDEAKARLEALNYVNAEGGWVVCNRSDANSKSKLTAKNTLSMEFFSGGDKVNAPIASIVVNLGWKRLDVLIEASVLLVDENYAGVVTGHCGNGNGVDTDDNFLNIDRIPEGESLFAEPHLTSGFSELHRDAAITPAKLVRIAELANSPHVAGLDHPLFSFLTPAERAEYIANPENLAATLEASAFVEYLDDCVGKGGSHESCSLEWKHLKYKTEKFRTTCHKEHPGLELSNEAEPLVITNCVEECVGENICPFETDAENFDRTPTNCPPPDTTKAWQACSFWGDPHFQAYFDKTRKIDYDKWVSQHQHSRGKVRLQKGYNNYKLGLLRLFQTKDKTLEAQAFMCDARGHTTSTAAIAIRRGAKIATFMRPNATGGKAWGNNLNKRNWFGPTGEPSDFGLELNIQGTEVKWSDLPGAAEFPHSSYQGNDEVLETYVQGSWFVQPLFIHDTKDKDNAFKPMCLGDVDRQIMVKASVPRVHRIYEPVVTIELNHDLVLELEDEGLCMGKDAADRAQDLSYSESLFTVAQLYQLCHVCGMLDGGGVHREGKGEDWDGWVSSAEFNGCIHPGLEQKTLTGIDICGGPDADLTRHATSHCNDLGLEEATVGFGWHDSCLAEYCNTDDDAEGQHVEGENGALNVASMFEASKVEAIKITDEYADDSEEAA